MLGCKNKIIKAVISSEKDGGKDGCWFLGNRGSKKIKEGTNENIESIRKRVEIRKRTCRLIKEIRKWLFKCVAQVPLYLRWTWLQK